MKDVGQPARLPWYPAYRVAANVLWTQLIGRLPGGKRPSTAVPSARWPGWSGSSTPASDRRSRRCRRDAATSRTDSMAGPGTEPRAVGLTWGQRALVVGATHPVLFIGTAQHTSHRETPWTRLALTARFFETVFLGTRDEADKALLFTARRHARSSARPPSTAGRTPRPARRTTQRAAT